MLLIPHSPWGSGVDRALLRGTDSLARRQTVEYGNGKKATEALSWAK